METPKEKSKELVKKFWMKNKTGQDSYDIAIGNSKIAVEEIIKNTDMYNGDLNPKWKFWNDVKTQLEKM